MFIKSGLDCLVSREFDCGFLNVFEYGREQFWTENNEIHSNTFSLMIWTSQGKMKKLAGIFLSRMVTV